MKVLFLGDLDRYGTCYSRLQSLTQFHANIVTFDDHLYQVEVGRVSRWKRDIAARTVGKRANAALLDNCSEKKLNLIWVDKGEWITPSTLHKLRATGTYLVRHITDALYPTQPLLMRWRRRALRRTIPCFDLHFTSNERDYLELRDQPLFRTELTDLGYDHRRFHNEPLSPELKQKWASDVLFVGHYERRTEAAVLALIDAGINVLVCGHSPWFRSPYRKRLGDHLRPALSNEDYEAAIKATNIGLCCVSEWNYNQTAARSFEIPASGTFLLAMRSPHHLEYYHEGTEAEFFEGHEELVRKAKYYLEHDAERERVAAQGHRRCVESGYSWDAIMKRDWQKVLAHYERFKSARVPA